MKLKTEPILEIEATMTLNSSELSYLSAISYHPADVYKSVWGDNVDLASDHAKGFSKFLGELGAEVKRALDRFERANYAIEGKL